MSKDSLNRRAPYKDTRQRVLILSEGEKTEILYLEGVCRLLRLTNVKIQGPSGAPVTMVDKAVSEKRTYEEIWCVLDVDEHPNLSSALDRASANQINTALSNPCFEVFLVLHFELYTKPCDKDQIQHHLKQHIPHYDKHVDFTVLWPLFADANARNEILKSRHTSQGTKGTSPSTEVFSLIKRLQELHQSQTPNREKADRNRKYMSSSNARAR